MLKIASISRDLFPPFGVVFFSAVLALGAALPKPCLAGDQKIATITAVRGSVMLKTPGSDEMHRAVVGDAVAVGEVIMTGAGSHAQMTLADESLVLLSHDSSSRINQFSFDPKTNRRTAVVRVIKGTARVVIFKVRSPESDLTVESDTAAIIFDNLGDCIVISDKEGTEIVSLGQNIRVKNVLPYVIGQMRLNANQKVLVPEKRPPLSPFTVSAEERGLLLRDFRSP